MISGGGGAQPSAPIISAAPLAGGGHGDDGVRWIDTESERMSQRAALEDGPAYRQLHRPHMTNADMGLFGGEPGFDRSPRQYVDPDKPHLKYVYAHGGVANNLRWARYGYFKPELNLIDMDKLVRYARMLPEASRLFTDCVTSRVALDDWNAAAILRHGRWSLEQLLESCGWGETAAMTEYDLMCETFERMLQTTLPPVEVGPMCHAEMIRMATAARRYADGWNLFRARALEEHDAALAVLRDATSSVRDQLSLSSSIVRNTPSSLDAKRSRPRGVVKARTLAAMASSSDGHVGVNGVLDGATLPMQSQFELTADFYDATATLAYEAGCYEAALGELGRVLASGYRPFETTLRVGMLAASRLGHFDRGFQIWLLYDHFEFLKSAAAVEAYATLVAVGATRERGSLQSGTHRGAQIEPTSGGDRRRRRHAATLDGGKHAGGHVPSAMALLGQLPALSEAILKPQMAPHRHAFDKAPPRTTVTSTTVSWTLFGLQSSYGPLPSEDGEATEGSSASLRTESSAPLSPGMTPLTLRATRHQMDIAAQQHRGASEFVLSYVQSCRRQGVAFDYEVSTFALAACCRDRFTGAATALAILDETALLVSGPRSTTTMLDPSYSTSTMSPEMTYLLLRALRNNGFQPAAVSDDLDSDRSNQDPRRQKVQRDGDNDTDNDRHRPILWSPKAASAAVLSHAAAVMARARRGYANSPLFPLIDRQFFALCADAGALLPFGAMAKHVIAAGDGICRATPMELEGESMHQTAVAAAVGVKVEDRDGSSTAVTASKDPSHDDVKVQSSRKAMRWPQSLRPLPLPDTIAVSWLRCATNAILLGTAVRSPQTATASSASGGRGGGASSTSGGGQPPVEAIVLLADDAVGQCLRLAQAAAADGGIVTSLPFVLALARYAAVRKQHQQGGIKHAGEDGKAHGTHQRQMKKWLDATSGRGARTRRGRGTIFSPDIDAYLSSWTWVTVAHAAEGRHHARKGAKSGVRRRQRARCDKAMGGKANAFAVTRLSGLELMTWATARVRRSACGRKSILSRRPPVLSARKTAIAAAFFRSLGGSDEGGSPSSSRRGRSPPQSPTTAAKNRADHRYHLGRGEPATAVPLNAELRRALTQQMDDERLGYAALAAVAASPWTLRPLRSKWRIRDFDIKSRRHGQYNSRNPVTQEDFKRVRSTQPFGHMDINNRGDYSPTSAASNT